ncbi:MAG: hypothetical protein HQ596_07110 [Candidatus Saganbacteria bacterium]|nr:hypothetical protein [Candidatus Saganbacteria bacterium]
MKKVFIVLLFVFLATSIASAEILCTGMMLEKGKWAVAGVGLQDSNVANTSGYSITSYALKGAYGITDQLELALAYSSSNYGGLPAGLTMSATAYTIYLKYGILKESEGKPVSVALGIGYKGVAQTSNLTGTSNGSKTGVGVIVSKIYAPFIPYLGLTYNGISLAGQNNTLEITVGTGIAWSTQGAVFIEYTNQAYSGDGGSYSSPQIGIGVGYNI